MLFSHFSAGRVIASPPMLVLVYGSYEIAARKTVRYQLEYLLYGLTEYALWRLVLTNTE